MPSWQARFENTCVRAFVRQRRWGDDQAVARKARRVFKTPSVLRWIGTRGLRVVPVHDEVVRGEWIVPDEAAAGVIFYIHGGGYVSCSAANHRSITGALARLTRRRVFSLNYRLAPEHRFPAASDDALAAYRWLLDQTTDPNRIAVAGDSAGGGLALVTLLRARDANLTLPACAVLFSPWTDMTGTSDSVRANDGRCTMFRTENIREFAAAYLGAASPHDPFASPVFADLAGLPPLLLQVGSTELLLDDARRVHDRVRQAGGESTLEIYEDVTHCWQMLNAFVPEARAAMRQAADFIVAATGRVGG